MEDVHFKARRAAAGFLIEDTRTGEFVPGEEIDDVFVANQVAARLERAEWAEEVAPRLEEAGSTDLAAELRDGLPRDVLLGRLRERGEAGSPAAQILVEAPPEPR